MRKIMKRGFCLFLVAVLLAGLMPCAFADEAMPTGEVKASEAATEAAEETTAPPETAVPSESTEPPSETTEPPEATETTESETECTEPEADPVEDAPEDVVEDERLAAYASTVTNVLLFDKASPNYTKGFDLPKTGDHGTWMYSLVGILLMSTAAGVIVLTVKKKNGR